MSSCVEVILAWAIGGVELRRWHGVPVQTTFLDDLISEDFLEEQPCAVKVVHNATVLSRPLHHELGEFTTHAEEGVVTFGLVRVQEVRYDLVPYLCLGGGETAVRVRELEVSFTCPRRQPERFSHAFAALDQELDGKPEKHFGRQVVELMKSELPGCVLRRKISRFFSDVNGPHSPLAVRCVLLLDCSGEMHLRMDTCWYTMVEDPDDAAVAEVEAAVNFIYKATF